MTPLLDEYLAWLRDARGLALSSVQTTEKHLRDFFRRMGELDLQAVTIRDLDRYATRLGIDRLAVSTRRARLISVRGFFAFLVSRGHLKVNPAANIALPRGRTERNPDVFTGPEIERLIMAERILAPKGKKEPAFMFQRRVRLHPLLNLRDKVLLALVYELGLRPGEIALLERADLEKPGRWWILTIRKAKHSDSPTPLPIEPGFVSTLLEEYLSELARMGIAHPALFPALSGTRPGSRNIGISADEVRRILKRRIRLAGVDVGYRHLSGHSLRRSRATHVYEKLPSIERIQVLLRHKDLSSTKSYIRVASTVAEHKAFKRFLPWNARRLGTPPS